MSDFSPTAGIVLRNAQSHSLLFLLSTNYTFLCKDVQIYSPLSTQYLCLVSVKSKGNRPPRSTFRAVGFLSICLVVLHLTIFIADANGADPIQILGRGTNLRKYDLDDYLSNFKPLPEFCQMSWGLFPQVSPSSTSKPSPRCALNTLIDLNPGKERKVEGKKPVEEDYDSVKVDMTESEAYEMVEKEEAEMAGWEEL